MTPSPRISSTAFFGSQTSCSTALARSMIGIISPYMKPVWCAIGEAISTTSSLPSAQPLGVGNDVGHQRVGRVHHALGLAGGAGGVDELGDVVGAGPVARQDRRARRAPSPTRASLSSASKLFGAARRRRRRCACSCGRLGLAAPRAIARGRSRGRPWARSAPWLRRGLSMNDSSRSRKMCINGLSTAPMREQAR